MYLHQSKNDFKELIELTAEHFKISQFLIEKDYYVTLILKELFNNDPNFIFKGGTSLSKCFHLIQRFSEDIDLNYLVTPLNEKNVRVLKT